ncbi:MAG: FliM/FliN family flagellar motor switch protein [Archangium sp.]
MNDSPTVITHTAAPLPKVADMRHAYANRTKLVPTQKLTRAHVAASQRPMAIESFTAAATRIATTLGEQLKTTVRCVPTLLNATVHPFSHLAAKSLFVTLELGGDALGVVEIDALGVGALISAITGANEAVGLPSRLSNIEESALGWVVLSVLSELRKESCFAGIAPRMISMTLDRGEVLSYLDGRRRHVALQLTTQLGSVSSLVRVLLPALWVQSKLESLPIEQPPAALASVTEATVPAICIIGSALLPRNEARALDAGDVVLFSGVSQQADGLVGPGRVVSELFELRGNFTEAGFTLTRAIERSAQESTMSNVDPSIPVEIEIELTRLRVSLDQLGTVRAGAVIPLHINAAQQVVVRIGDKAVARAELVEIEGEIGARIISML